MKCHVMLTLLLVLIPGSLALGVTTEDEVEEALGRRDAARLRKLIPDLEDPDWISIRGEKTNLMLALAKNNLCDLLPFLVEQGARTDISESTAGPVIDSTLRACLWHTRIFQPELLEFFIEQRLTPTDILRHVAYYSANEAGSNSPTATAVFLVQSPALYKIMAWAITEGADVDVESRDAPIIYWLSKAGLTDYVKLLLDNGANPNASDNNTRTAREMAGNLEVKKLLEDAGARR